MTSLRRLCACVGLLASAVPAVAEDRNDAALWTVSQGNVPIDERFSIHAMVQNRWTQDLERYQRTVLRLWLSAALGMGFQLDLGYDAHIFENPRSFTEHRAWQRLNYRREFGRFALFGHLWLEERFFPGDELAWRGRFGIGGEVDLLRGFTALVRNDFMVDLNETGRIRSTGLGENQLFALLRRRLTSWLQMDIGYLMQFLDRRGGDLYNHTLIVGFAVTTPALVQRPGRGSGRDGRR